MIKTKNITPCRQRGLSLVELMVALVVGLVLLAGVLAVFLASRQSYGITNAESHIQEDGRFSLDYLTHDIRMGGYMGCLKNGNLANVLNSPDNSVLSDFSDPVDGYQASNVTLSGTSGIVTINTTPPVATGSASYLTNTATTPTLDSSISSNALPGSDVIVVHSVSTQPIFVTSVTGNQTATIFLSSNTNIAKGQFGIVSNCVSGVVFQVSGPASGGTGSGNIVTNTGGSTSPGNSSKIVGMPGVGPGSQFFSPNTVAYYIGKGADGSPALFRADAGNSFSFTPEELVPDVENMQILYGISDNGQVANQYVTANNVPNWNQVVSVKVGLLLASGSGAMPIPTNAPSFNVLNTKVTVQPDTRLRRVFTTTIGLRNLLP